MEPDEGRAPAEPIALYEGPRLTWFRGWPLVGLIVVSVAAGAGVHAAWGAGTQWLAARRLQEQLPRDVSPHHAARVAPARLAGPGTQVQLPPGEPTVVNVWLQGCADCMASFEAWRDARARGALSGAPIVNVAFGRADAAWATRYGVHEQLVLDDGKALVEPLGIRTFTTLLLDQGGRVLLRGSPRDPGFLDRLEGGLAVAQQAHARDVARRLVGQWTGSYLCRQGVTALTLDVFLVDDELRARFQFSAHPDNPGVPPGAFTMAGAYDTAARTLTFRATEADWLRRPANYVTVDLRGAVALDRMRYEGAVESEGCGTFTLEKQAELAGP